MNVNGGKRTKKKRKRPRGRGRGRGEEEKVGPKEANFDIDDVDGVLVEEDRRGGSSGCGPFPMRSIKNLLLLPSALRLQVFN